MVLYDRFPLSSSFNSNEPFRRFSKFRTSKLDAEEEPPKNQMKPVMDVQVVIGKAEKAVAEATSSAAHKIPFIKKTIMEKDVFKTSQSGPKTSQSGQRHSESDTQTPESGTKIQESAPKTSKSCPRTSESDPRTSESGPRTAGNRRLSSSAVSASNADRPEAKPKSLSKCDKPAVIKPEASRAKTEPKPDAMAVKSIKKENVDSKYSTPNR